MNPIQRESWLHALRRWAWLIIIASLVVQWAAGWTETSFVVLLCAVGAIAVWYGWQGLRHLVHHLRLRMTGHITTASIVAYRELQESGERGYMPLVSFVTNAGEQRQLIPLTTLYDDRPQAPGVAPDRTGTGVSGSSAPPIGHSLRVVYDPADPTWVDQCSWSMFTVSTIQCLSMIVLFGALLISALATQIPAIRNQ